MKALSNIIKNLNIPLGSLQYGDPITPETVEAGFNFVDNGMGVGQKGAVQIKIPFPFIKNN